MTPDQERDFNDRLEAMFRAHPEARAAFAADPDLFLEARDYFLRRQAELRGEPEPYGAADFDRFTRSARHRLLARRAAQRSLASFALCAFAFAFTLVYSALATTTGATRTPVILCGGAAAFGVLYGLWNGVRWAQYSAEGR